MVYPETGRSVRWTNDTSSLGQMLRRKTELTAENWEPGLLRKHL